MNLIHKVNCSLVYFVLIIDMMNGLLMFNGIGLPISQIFKGIFTVLLFVGLTNFSFSKAFLWFSLFIYFLISPNFFNLFTPLPESVISSITLSQKFLFTILVYLYFKEAFNRNYRPRLSLFLILNISILAINIILSVSGYGYFSYSSGIGATGFFYSGNELSFAALLLFSYYLFLNYENSGYKFYIHLVFIFILSILLAMKIVIAGVLLTALFFLLKKKDLGLKIFIFLCLGIIITIFFDQISFFISPLWEMWKFNFNKANNIFNFILSDRDIFLREELTQFWHSNPLQIIFGTGLSETVEMDIFDALINYGLVGVIIIYSFYCKIIFDIKRIPGKDLRTFGLFITTLSIVASSFAGHFVFSAMSGFVFAYLTSIIVTNKY